MDLILAQGTVAQDEVTELSENGRVSLWMLEISTWDVLQSPHQFLHLESDTSNKPPSGTVDQREVSDSCPVAIVRNT